MPARSHEPRQASVPRAGRPSFAAKPSGVRVRLRVVPIASGLPRHATSVRAAGHCRRDHHPRGRGDGIGGTLHDPEPGRPDGWSRGGDGRSRRTSRRRGAVDPCTRRRDSTTARVPACASVGGRTAGEPAQRSDHAPRVVASAPIARGVRHRHPSFVRESTGVVRFVLANRAAAYRSTALDSAMRCDAVEHRKDVGRRRR